MEHIGAEGGAQVKAMLLNGLHAKSEIKKSVAYGKHYLSRDGAR